MLESGEFVPGRITVPQRANLKKILKFSIKLPALILLNNVICNSEKYREGKLDIHSDSLKEVGKVQYSRKRQTLILTDCIHS